MNAESKINIGIFKTVTKAIAQSNNLDIMANHLAQLLVAAMNIKACAIFTLDPETSELEPLASFGLSIKYVSKGPVLAQKSIADNLKGKPVVISDVANSDHIQYPEAAIKEGITAILSIPIAVSDHVLGALRLYHDQVWHVSDEDVDSLLLLAEIIGLAMNYTSLLRAMYTIEDIFDKGLPPNLVRGRSRD